MASNTSEIGVADFVRGPGQELNLPANSTDGIPITSDGAAIPTPPSRSMTGADLLSITAVTAGASLPAGSNVRLRVQVSDGSGPGDLIEAGIDDVSICPAAP